MQKWLIRAAFATTFTIGASVTAIGQSPVPPGAAPAESASPVAPAASPQASGVPGVGGGDPAADLWLLRQGREGAAVVRLDGITGQEKGSLPAIADRCAFEAIAVSPTGVWVLDANRPGPALPPGAPDISADFDLCIAWLPFDGSGSQVTRVPLEDGENLSVSGRWAIGADLFMGAAFYTPASFEPRGAGLYRLTVGGVLEKVVALDPTSLAFDGSSFWTIKSKGRKNTPVRIDPATGTASPVKLSLRSSELTRVDAGDGLVVFQSLGTKIPVSRAGEVLDGTTASRVARISPKVRGRSLSSLAVVLVQDGAMWSMSDGVKQGLFVTPAKDGAKTKRLATACSTDCSLNMLGSTSGALWTLRVPFGGGETVMERWNTATRAKTLEIARNPYVVAIP